MGFSKNRLLLCLLCMVIVQPLFLAHATQLPITEEPITISYWVGMHSNAAKVLTTWNDNDCFVELEKRTGIHVEFIHPPIGQEQEKYNLMIAARDLPDIISRDYPDGADKAFADGIYRPIEDIAVEYCPNMMAIIDSNEEVRKQMYTNEGHLWGWAAFNLREDYAPLSGSPWGGPAIRQDWLDELGLSTPMTIDDWYNMLIAFRDVKGAQVPLIINKNGRPGGAVFMGAYGVGEAFYRDAIQVVHYGPAEPGFKEYLSLMRKWYDEGLLDPDFAATASDANFYSEYLTTGKAGSIANTYQDIVPLYNSLLAGGVGEIKAVPYPRMNADDAYHFAIRSFEVEGGSRDYLSTSCPEEKIEVLAKWRDYWYSDEGTLLFNYGIEGKSYNIVDGVPVYTDLLDNDEYGVYSWKYKLFCHGYRYNPYAKPQSQIDASWASIGTWFEGNAMDYVMPNIAIPAEFATEFTSIRTEIETYRDQMILKFIMGVEPLDKFDDYVSELKSLGLDRALELQQMGLDLYNSH